MAMSYVLAAGIGLGGGNGFIDFAAPIYTIFIGSLVLNKIYGNKDEVILSEQVSAASDTQTQSSGSSGGKSISDLVEPSSGTSVPSLLNLTTNSGTTTEMVSLSCGIRLKKVAGFNVKIYVLGIFVEKSENTAKILEPFKTSPNNQLFDSMLSIDEKVFFSRALHLTFCRSVTGKQVADALGERLKAKVTPEAFDSFSNTLLTGIGSKGMATNETLSFHWYEVKSLRIYVRGVPVGEVHDEKLPKAIHAGFLGDDPSIPEARTNVLTGLNRLFTSVGTGGGTKRAGRALVPATMKEPLSGLDLPTKIEMGTAEVPMSMHLLSCGLQVKKLGFVSVQVYAAGILVEPVGAKKDLAGWFKAATESANGGPGSADSLYEALLSKEVFFPRALHLVFCRSVSGKQVADSLAERLKAAVSPEAFESFSSILLAGIDTGINKGESLSYLWFAPNSLRIFVRGVAVGEVHDEKLPKAIHSGFLGNNDPNAPQAKDGVPAAMIKLLASR